jgi:hypothetical protein
MGIQTDWNTTLTSVNEGLEELNLNVDFKGDFELRGGGYCKTKICAFKRPN